MKRNFSKRPCFYYITGPDGIGKSTQTELLVAYLKSQGIRCERLWLRFPFFFSIPFLAYARLWGFSWHEVNGEINNGYWDFSCSWVMRKLFPWFLFIDATLAAAAKIYLPLLMRKSIVCERFVLDMLVDLWIAIQDPSVSEHLPGRLFINLIPDNSKIVVLDLDQDTICNRRPGLVLDHALASRLEVYRLLANHLKLPIIDNHQSISMVFQEILKTISVV